MFGTFAQNKHILLTVLIVVAIVCAIAYLALTSSNFKLNNAANPNMTLTLQQVNSTLPGKWWIAVPSNMSYIDQNTSEAQITFIFENQSYLNDYWLKFNSSAEVQNILNSTFIAPNGTKGMLGGATYNYWSNQSANVSVLYASDGPYLIILSTDDQNRTNSSFYFSLDQGKQLLAYQLSDLQIN